MQVHYQLDQLPDFRKSVITIGSFDGLHKGHQELIKQVKNLAVQKDGESVVITFSPHPRQVIYPNDRSLELLNTTNEKVELFSKLGIDHLVVVPFTVAFSQISADEYISEFLVKNFKPHCIVIGYDHRFGLNRQGDINFLKWHGTQFGYEVVQIEAEEVANLTVSSTKIRTALKDGNLRTAHALLGYHYPLHGLVVKGQQIGRSIGYPTANLALSDPYKLIPAEGIYAARAQWGDQLLDGMLYIGRRPTLDDGEALTIELNIFDFNHDIYGDELTIYLIAFIREDAQLEGLENLKKQLHLDELQARKMLQQLPVVPQQKEIGLATAIVILNYNGLEYLKAFLPKLEESLAPNCRIVIADNKSTDDSLSWLAQNYPALERVELAENYGFAGGYNEALRQVKADVFVLLNSDVEVSNNWLAPCLDLLANDETVGACQPKILAQKDRQRFEYAGGAGGWIDNLGYPFCRGRVFAHTEIDSGQYDAAQEIFWASGAALFIRSKLFHELGGFEAEYFAHAEEIDLCWRLKRAGYRIMAQPASVVYHVGGGTLNYNTPRKTYLNFHNTLVTSFKNESGRKLIWWLPLRLIMDGLAGGLFLVQGNWAHIQAIIRAHWHFFPKLPFWWRRRKLRKMQIAQACIGEDRTDKGRFKGSVVAHYYLLGNKRFSKILRKR